MSCVRWKNDRKKSDILQFVLAASALLIPSSIAFGPGMNVQNLPKYRRYAEAEPNFEEREACAGACAEAEAEPNQYHPGFDYINPRSSPHFTVKQAHQPYRRAVAKTSVSTAPKAGAASSSKKVTSSAGRVSTNKVSTIPKPRIGKSVNTGANKNKPSSSTGTQKTGSSSSRTKKTGSGLGTQFLEHGGDLMSGAGSLLQGADGLIQDIKRRGAYEPLPGYRRRRRAATRKATTSTSTVPKVNSAPKLSTGSTSRVSKPVSTKKTGGTTSTAGRRTGSTSSKPKKTGPSLGTQLLENGGGLMSGAGSLLQGVDGLIQDVKQRDMQARRALNLPMKRALRRKAALAKRDAFIGSSVHNYIHHLGSNVENSLGTMIHLPRDARPVLEDSDKPKSNDTASSKSSFTKEEKIAAMKAVHKLRLDKEDPENSTSSATDSDSKKKGSTKDKQAAFKEKTREKNEHHRKQKHRKAKEEKARKQKEKDELARKQKADSVNAKHAVKPDLKASNGTQSAPATKPADATKPQDSKAPVDLTKLNAAKPVPAAPAPPGAPPAPGAPAAPASAKPLGPNAKPPPSIPEPITKVAARAAELLKSWAGTD
ncbi:hypothetical protein MMC13_004793 [Lambiella insularis]|nr:hypothetical protein [Lambiella insularis]